MGKACSKSTNVRKTSVGGQTEIERDAEGRRESAIDKKEKERLDAERERVEAASKKLRGELQEFEETRAEREKEIADEEARLKAERSEFELQKKVLDQEVQQQEGSKEQYKKELAEIKAAAATEQAKLAVLRSEQESIRAQQKAIEEAKKALMKERQRLEKEGQEIEEAKRRVSMAATLQVGGDDGSWTTETVEIYKEVHRGPIAEARHMEPPLTASRMPEPKSKAEMNACADLADGVKRCGRTCVKNSKALVAYLATGEAEGFSLTCGLGSAGCAGMNVPEHDKNRCVVCRNAAFDDVPLLA